MLKGRTDLPLARDATGRFLPWIVALMVYLATLALAGAMEVSSMAARWDSGLAGTLTVEVSPIADAGAPPLDRRVDAALEILRRTPGVAAARRLTDAEIARLLAPWLGEGGRVEGLPIPTLLDVKLAPGATVDISALTRRLARAAPGATVDDHAAWLRDLLALSRTAELVALAIVALIGGAAVIAVIFVARAGLAIHREVVEVLHLVGAADRYVARQFQRHVMTLSLWGALGGLALAIATLVGVDHAAGRLQATLLPSLSLSPGQWLTLAAVPAAAILIATVTARVTVMRTLARLP